MIRPFKGTFTVTQEWGINAADYAKFGLSGHNGVDYGTPTGIPILAPHNGTVIESAFDQYGYGNYVKIENDQEGSILAHFKSFNVNAGDTVSEGQQVGISDNTGNSTGPHLHWGYFRKPRNKSDGYSGTTNPYPYFSETPTPPVDDCPLKLKQVTEERDKLNGVITGKDETISHLGDTINAKNAEIATANTTITSHEQRLITLQSQVDTLTEQAKQVSGLKDQLEQAEETKKLYAGQISKLQTQIGTIKSKLVPKKYLSLKVYNFLMSIE